MSYLNDNDLNLRFIGDSSSTSINHLDVSLGGENGRVTTSIFRKSTAGNTLSGVDSSHPKHTLRGIPVEQFLRLKRICSNGRDYKREAENMFKCFEDRGYPRTILHRAMNLADNTPREHLLRDGTSNRIRNRSYANSSFQTPVFSTPFSTEYNKIKNIVLKYLPVLSHDPIYAEILSKGVKTVSPRAPTLGRTLSPSSYMSKSPRQHWLQFKGTFRCGSNGCSCCKHVLKGDSIQATVIKKLSRITYFISYNTRYLVYVITCNVIYSI